MDASTHAAPAVPDNGMIRSRALFRPGRFASETAREREVMRYVPYLHANFRVNASGQPMASSELFTSRDCVLTALAQLALQHTKTERAFISLFDPSYQYIVAEATPSTPLTPGVSSDSCPTRLLLCGNAIPRHQAACEIVLSASNNTQSTQPDEPPELPLFLIPDLTADDRFSSKPYCRGIGDLPQFYAAVPVRTSRGIDIGSLSVRSSPKASQWDDGCTRSLREISRAVMDHLEAQSLKHAHRRNERVTRGLGSFIEGKTTLSGWQHRPNVAAFEDQSTFEGRLDTAQQFLDRQQGLQENDAVRDPMIGPSVSETEASRLQGAPATNFGVSHASSASINSALSNTPPDPLVSEETDIDEPNMHPVFSKAANIIREAFEIEGCVFYDVSLGSYSSLTVQTPVNESDVGGRAGRFSSSSSEDLASESPGELPDSQCELLGYSTSYGSSINAVKPLSNKGVLGKQFLAKLLRRYPEGKIFNFDAIGELQSSDSSGNECCTYTMLDKLPPHSQLGNDAGDSTTQKRRSRNVSPFRRTREGALIQQAFASARSVAFVPVWDSKRERWFAGGFVYTLTPGRSFTGEGELSLLRVFSKIVAADVHNSQTLQANQAKSDALGSLSHELRSPLHGIILSAEILNDTDLSVFQGNATHTIETCCRTLLDTIDHLLDYAKVNSFLKRRNQDSRLRQRPGSEQFGRKTLYFNARLDGLVEEVIESVYAGYNFQHMSIRQLAKQDIPKIQADVVAHHRLDKAQAIEQLDAIPSAETNGEAEYSSSFGDVSVFLLVDQACDWMFNLPGGAVRRIIMNIFGNSIKYTDRGAIRISLSQEKASGKRTKRLRDRLVRICVQDTGKGIRDDYIKHDLFKPFSQENELASGTGLGLSLVKKIVSELRGQILVESQVGFGTRVTVTLPLEQSPPDVDKTKEDKNFEDLVQEVSGLRVSLIGFASDEIGKHDRLAIMEGICRDALHMNIIPHQNTQQLAPDVVIWLEAALPGSPEKLSQLARTPNVVVCPDAFAAYRRSSMHDKAGYSGVLDFVSQPVGPRKVAKSIQLAYRRWSGLSQAPSPPLGPPGLSRSHSFHGVSHNDVAAASVSLSRLHRPTQSSKPSEMIGSQHSSANVTPSQSLLVPVSGTESQGSITADKILLVDDNHINLTILSVFMDKLDRRYESAVNGKQALDIYVRNPSFFAVILMDISMPVMDGLEATRQIRNFECQGRLPRVAIIALTGLASQQTQKEALESGVDIYLTKPVRFASLNEVLSSIKPQHE